MQSKVEWLPICFLVGKGISSRNQTRKWVWGFVSDVCLVDEIPAIYIRISWDRTPTVLSQNYPHFDLLDEHWRQHIHNFKNALCPKSKLTEQLAKIIKSFCTNSPPTMSQRVYFQNIKKSTTLACPDFHFLTPCLEPDTSKPLLFMTNSYLAAGLSPQITYL